MKIRFTLEFFKSNFSNLNKWYRENYRHLSPKKRKLWKNVLGAVANDMVIDINKERSFPKEWRKKYQQNIIKCRNNLLELELENKLNQRRIKNENKQRNRR